MGGNRKTPPLTAARSDVRNTHTVTAQQYQYQYNTIHGAQAQQLHNAGSYKTYAAMKTVP